MGAVFSIFGGIYYWFNKITGIEYSEVLAQIHFWVFFTGVNITFFPMHWLGVAGMPRRIPDYPDAFYTFNKIASWGSEISAFSLLIFLIVLLEAFFNKNIFKLPENKFLYTYFPVMWYFTFIEKRIPKMLGIIGAIQFVVFSRIHMFFIIALWIGTILLITWNFIYSYHNNQEKFNSIDEKFLKYEFISDSSYWSTFKDEYFYNGNETTSESSDTFESSQNLKSSSSNLIVRNYSTSSIVKLSTTYQAAKAYIAKKLVGIGSNMGATQTAGAKLAGSKAAGAKLAGSQAAGAKLAGSQAAGAKTFEQAAVQATQAAGTSVVWFTIIGGTVIFFGGDQVARYGIENAVNKATQSNYEIPPFKMKPPAQEWGFRDTTFRK